MSSRKKAKKTTSRKVASHAHKEDKRKNIPNAEHQSVLTEADREVKILRYSGKRFE